jgi:predicted DNA-binding transcriptional regulator AlpA
MATASGSGTTGRTGLHAAEDGVVAATVRIIEIAELLGVTHQRASVIVRQPGFPKPVGRAGQSRLWHRREVTAWA